MGVRKGLKKRQRLEFKDYQAAIAKKDRKMNRPLLNAYELLHKSLGYDGITLYRVVQDSLDQARIVIDWADKHYQNVEI